MSQHKQHALTVQAARSHSTSDSTSSTHSQHKQHTVTVQAARSHSTSSMQSQYKQHAVTHTLNQSSNTVKLPQRVYTKPKSCMTWKQLYPLSGNLMILSAFVCSFSRSSCSIRPSEQQQQGGQQQRVGQQQQGGQQQARGA